MSERRAARLVWCAWAVLAAVSLALIAYRARNVPWWDDWKLVPVLLGGKAADAAWLWEQGNEHRFPLAKLLLLLLARLSDGDLRWAMALSALLLAGLAAAFLATVRRLTGGLRWTDAALPLALLGAGHADNLLWHVQLHFVLAVVLGHLALLCLLRLAHAEERGEAGSRGLLAALLATAGLLPLHSGIGLCLSPPLALWMLLAARRVRDPGRRRALLGCAALMAALIAVYLLDLPTSPAANVGFQGVAATALTALQCAAMSLGPVGRLAWPWSGAFVAAVLLASVVMLVRVVARMPARRLGASVPLTALLATALLALSIGISRAGLGWSAGFSERYVTLMAPALCWAYLAWRLHGDGGAACASVVPGAAGVDPGSASGADGARGACRAACFVLCVALIAALPLDTTAGLRHARQRAAVLDDFAARVRAGTEPAELARTHGTLIAPDADRLAARLELLRQRRAWLYR